MNENFSIFDKESEKIWQNQNSEIKTPDGTVLKKAKVVDLQQLSIYYDFKQLEAYDYSERRKIEFEEGYLQYLRNEFNLPEKEKLIERCIWVKDGEKHDNQPIGITTGFVISPAEIMNFLSLLTTGSDTLPCEIGYLTNHNRFVQISEARVIAQRNKQLTIFFLNN